MVSDFYGQLNRLYLARKHRTLQALMVIADGQKMIVQVRVPREVALPETMHLTLHVNERDREGIFKEPS